jgi:hypothetical protein
MYSDKLNYKIIDNLPQKKMEKLDVQLINQMIEGYDTVQNTLDINSTNKYDLDKNSTNNISIKKINNDSDKKKNYVVLMDSDQYENDNDMDYDDYIKKNNIINSTKPNKLNAINTFYIGSLTVVGLFIFYRMIQKTK